MRASVKKLYVVRSLSLIIIKIGGEIGEIKANVNAVLQFL